jgi:hypothetical protein
MEFLNNMAQIITITRLCAYDMQGYNIKVVAGKRLKYTFMFTAEGDLAILQTALFKSYDKGI